MIAVLVGFTALCVLYVAWCDRIIGPDPAPVAPAAGDPDHQPVAGEVTA